MDEANVCSRGLSPPGPGARQRVNGLFSGGLRTGLFASRFGRREGSSGGVMNGRVRELRVTRHFSNGECAEDAVPLSELGALIARRPGRAIALAWAPAPRSVLVVATPHSRAARAALPVVIRTLRHLGCEHVLVESDEMAALVERSATHPARTERPATVTVTPWREDPCAQGVREEVDVVICLGGDGLILHVVSELFPHAVPPIMPFNLGSLGFLTPFNMANHEEPIARVLAGKKKTVTMRMRLRCVIVPKDRALDESWPPCPGGRVDGRASTPRTPTSDEEGSETSYAAEAKMKFGFSLDRQGSDSSERARAALHPRISDGSGLICHHVLNEIVIDRGPAPYLCNLEVLADDCPVTRVQADGLILATPTGSTAYSLSSGGSMVHPSVPAILFTPICPHSLSFRPVLFPQDAVLQVKVPEDARATAWVSFDGRHRMELMRGDKVVVWASEYPVPTFNAKDPTTDWFASVSYCLRWNERAPQMSLHTGHHDAERSTTIDSVD